MTPDTGTEGKIRKGFEVFLLSAYVRSARGVLMGLRPQAHIRDQES